MSLSDTLAHIPNFVDEPHVARALQLTHEIVDERIRANTLARLAPLLDDRQLAHAVEDIEKMADATGRVSVLVGLVPWLSEALLVKVESHTLSLESSESRAVGSATWFRDRQLLSIAECLPRGLLRRGPKLADAIKDDNLRASAWTALARRLDGEGRREAVARAVEVASHAEEPSLDYLDDLVRLTDEAAVIQHARRTLLAFVTSADSNKRVMETCAHAGALVSTTVVAHIAQHIVDVCWSWRWP